VKIRQFNRDGLSEFKRFLADARENPRHPVRRELLEDDRLTELIVPAVEVQPRSLPRREDAARCLKDLLKPLGDKAVVRNAGLWSWLTLFFFDEVCPAAGGQRLVKNDYHYLYEPANARHSYRHLLFIAWRVQQVAGSHTQLFLRGPLSTLDKMTSEVFKRLYLLRIRCLFEVLERLYWDAERGRPRSGCVDSQRVRPGDLTHRLPSRIRQLEKTYDLLDMTADQLLELLGDEFSPTPAVPATLDTGRSAVTGSSNRRRP
jgi:hypothetical protein